MNLPIKPRHPFLRVMLLSAASFAVGICVPSYANAAQAGPRSEERTARAEQRAARREAERTVRAQEREAARSARGADEADEAGANQLPSEQGSTVPEADTPAPASTATPANSERGCRVDIEASSTRITAGEAVTLSGTLRCPRSASASDQQVPIYERQGDGDFSVLATVTTEADGSYRSTPLTLSANTVFQVRERSHRARVTVKVAPAVTIAIAPTSAQASAAPSQTRTPTRTRTTFTGTVTPAVTGALVALQVASATSGGGWHSVAYGHVASDGSYALTHTFTTPGTASVRALVHIGRHYAPAASEPLSLLTFSGTPATSV